ncbi:MAG: hypothetical protein MR695_05925 [Solobacterium sp.]|nr:hypothetical protein [Solobacterium sp.]
MKNNKDKRYNFTFTGNKYMPERTKVYNHNIIVNVDEDSMLKDFVACQNWLKAIQLAKRAVRKEQKTSNVVYTVGIMVNDTQFIFTREKYVTDRYDLQGLLYIYKALKEQENYRELGKPVVIRLRKC